MVLPRFTLDRRPRAGPGSCGIGSIRFLPDGVKADLNHALVSLGLVLLMLVVV